MKRMLMRILGASISIGLALIIAVAVALRASLPRRAGTTTLAGLGAPVEIELDSRAIPRVRGQSVADVYRAQGFLHAQERFFQMDLARRSAAGELAALFGQRALAADRRQRLFQFRRRAERLAESLPSDWLSYLAAYTDGVNAGLADLDARPPEYFLLRQKPAGWTVEDSLLVFFSIYTMLSNNDSYEKGQGVMQATLPAEVFDFLTPSTSRFDRPLVALADSDRSGGYSAQPIPSALVVDLRLGIDAPYGVVAPPLNGAASNQWAVGGKRTVDGRAILANDPHLTLRIPNTFYRIELTWPTGISRGVSIPGVPGVLIGATEHIAWGATVSNADQSDFVVLKVDPEDANRYLTADGYEPLTVVSESIQIAGVDAPEVIEVELSRWGPVVDEDWLGRPLALHATWLDPDGVNLAILDLALADSAADAVATLGRWSGPSLNWIVADANGTIAWTVNGPLPQRQGFDGSIPRPWVDGHTGWDGFVEAPVEFDQGLGVLFTANNRTLRYRDSLALGRFWMRPLRAHRIAELLGPVTDFDERRSLAMQLDTRAHAFDFFRDLILASVTVDERDPLLLSARQHVAAWDGTADVDQIGFRILQLYYSELLDKLLAPLLAPASVADPDFVYRWPLADEPLRRILEERPAHFLPSVWTSWNEMLRGYLRVVLERVNQDPERANASAAWGEVNRLSIAHPLSELPLIGRWLRLDARPVPGSMATVRVAAPRYGAVFRMSVSPIAHDDGILQMAVGQSGHFLSPNFSDLQDDWSNGTPTPFLAGPTVEEFQLVPAD